MFLTPGSRARQVPRRFPAPVTMSAVSRSGQIGALNLSAVNAGIELGAQGIANTPFIDFHSSANIVDYDARIIGSGGSASPGAGTLSVTAAIFAASATITANLVNSATGFQAASKAFGINSSGYSVLYSGNGTDQNIFLGDATDAQNYYRNTTHRFQTIGGAVNILTMASGAADFTGTLSCTSTFTCSGDTLNFGSGAASAQTSMIINGGTGANGGGRTIIYKGATPKWQYGTKSTIFGGGSTSDDWLLYNHTVASALLVTASDSALNVLSATASSSTSTGALIVSGGVGIAGQLNVSTSGIVCGSFSVDASGFLAAVGITGRTGTGGTYDGNRFNLHWTGSATKLWVDTTDTGQITVTSDYRIKKDIKSAGPALAEVLQWRPITYTGKAWGVFEENDHVRHSFVAHELQKISPDCVIGDKDDEQPQSLDLVPMIARLAKAVQELNARIG